MGGLSLPISPFIPKGASITCSKWVEGGGFGDGGWEVGGKWVGKGGFGDGGWEREGLEIGEVGGVDNGWEGWIMGGRCSG